MASPDIYSHLPKDTYDSFIDVVRVYEKKCREGTVPRYGYDKDDDFDDDLTQGDTVVQQSQEVALAEGRAADFLLQLHGKGGQKAVESWLARYSDYQNDCAVKPKRTMQLHGFEKAIIGDIYPEVHKARAGMTRRAWGAAVSAGAMSASIGYLANRAPVPELVALREEMESDKRHYDELSQKQSRTDDEMREIRILERNLPQMKNSVARLEKETSPDGAITIMGCGVIGFIASIVRHIHKGPQEYRDAKMEMRKFLVNTASVLENAAYELRHRESGR